MALCAMFKTECYPAGEREPAGAHLVIMFSVLSVDLNGKIKTVTPTIKNSRQQDWIGMEPKSTWY